MITLKYFWGLLGEIDPPDPRNVKLNWNGLIVEDKHTEKHTSRDTCTIEEEKRKKWYSGNVKSQSKHFGLKRFG